MLEQLYENLVNITLFYCKQNPGHFSFLHDLLLRAIQHYPNNGLFYNAIYECEVCFYDFFFFFIKLIHNCKVNYNQ